jgi:hypothetical protein
MRGQGRWGEITFASLGVSERLIGALHHPNRQVRPIQESTSPFASKNYFDYDCISVPEFMYIRDAAMSAKGGYDDYLVAYP